MVNLGRKPSDLSKRGGYAITLPDGYVVDAVLHTDFALREVDDTDKGMDTDAVYEYYKTHSPLEEPPHDCELPSPDDYKGTICRCSKCDSVWGKEYGKDSWIRITNPAIAVDVTPPVINGTIFDTIGDFSDVDG